MLVISGIFDVEGIFRISLNRELQGFGLVDFHLCEGKLGHSDASPEVYWSCWLGRKTVRRSSLQIDSKTSNESSVVIPLLLLRWIFGMRVRPSGDLKESLVETKSSAITVSEGLQNITYREKRMHSGVHPLRSLCEAA